MSSLFSQKNQNIEDFGEVVVRSARATDAARMTFLLQSHYNWINVWNEPQDVIHRNVSDELMSTAILNTPAAVAQCDGTVIGFAVTRTQEPYLLEVRNIYVDDSFRNHGFGAQLLSLIEQMAREAGFRSLFATCSNAWYPTKAFPTGLFSNAGYDVAKLDATTQMYTRQIESPVERQSPELVQGITTVQRVPWIR